MLVITPLDANTMAKIANGLCDNLLVGLDSFFTCRSVFTGIKFVQCVQTCVVRAWDPAKPLLFCPAMNTAMWTHQLTGRHRQQLLELGYAEVPPVAKMLACGDEGDLFA